MNSLGGTFLLHDRLAKRHRRTMKGDAAERYHSRRVRLLTERRARQEEWDYLARCLRDEEVVDSVPNGWRPFVLRLHHDLLALDQDYRLYRLEEDLGGLLITARFALPTRHEIARRVQQARAEALSTCEVCSAVGRLRPERPEMRTLCDDCWSADRAAATERGEVYADAVLAYLVSADDDYPSPEETLAWLDELDHQG